MQELSSRTVDSVEIQGEEISFITSNERLAERVRNASHEAYVLDKLVEVADSEGTLWDVGACLGIHTFVASAFYDSVVAFEPMPTNRGILVDNLHANECENVYISRKALSDSYGEREFAIRQSQQPGYGRHSFDEGSYDSVRTLSVEAERGDAMTPLGFPNVVKIDVEGAEGLVLDGMRHVLSDDRCRHVILETHEPNPVQPSYEDFGYTEQDLLDALVDAGFSVERMDEDWHIYGRKT